MVRDDLQDKQRRDKADQSNVHSLLGVWWTTQRHQDDLQRNVLTWTFFKCPACLWHLSSQRFHLVCHGHHKHCTSLVHLGPRSTQASLSGPCFASDCQEALRTASDWYSRGSSKGSFVSQGQVDRTCSWNWNCTKVWHWEDLFPEFFEGSFLGSCGLGRYCKWAFGEWGCKWAFNLSYGRLPEWPRCTSSGNKCRRNFVSRARASRSSTKSQAANCPRSLCPKAVQWPRWKLSRLVRVATN